MEFSALAKAFSASPEVCRCILKSDFLKASYEPGPWWCCRVMRSLQRAERIREA